MGAAYWAAGFQRFQLARGFLKPGPVFFGCMAVLAAAELPQNWSCTQGTPKTASIFPRPPKCGQNVTNGNQGSNLRLLGGES